MYLWLKVIHVLAVVLFLGNIITGVFWHKHAERTRDPRLIAHTMAGVIRSDRLFTMPGVFVILRAASSRRSRPASRFSARAGSCGRS